MFDTQPIHVNHTMTPKFPSQALKTYMFRVYVWHSNQKFYYSAATFQEAEPGQHLIFNT